MVAIFPDFSVNIRQKRQAAILDPALALSPYGIPLIRSLAECMDLWVPRSFWQMLDNTHFYLSSPDAFNIDLLIGETPVWPNSEAILSTLREWEKIRATTDPASLKLFWIAEGPSESILPEEFEASIVARFETFSNCLDKRLTSENLLTWAFRDAIALSATLRSAIILTQLSTSSGAVTQPAICKVAQEWGLDNQQIAGNDAWLPLERDYFRQKMVLAGLAKLSWSGLRLAVLHVLAPVALFTPTNAADDFEAFSAELIGMEGFDYKRLALDYWQDAKVFWYAL